MAYDRDGLFEARPCPLGIPTPNDITLSQPQAAQDARGTPGVLYADDTKGHFGLVQVSGSGGGAGLHLPLVSEDRASPVRGASKCLSETGRKFGPTRALQPTCSRSVAPWRS